MSTLVCFCRVTFQLSTQTVQSTMNDIQTAMDGQRNRNIGGQILMFGGLLRLEGCT